MRNPLRRLPSPSHWFSGTAFLGLLMTLYSVGVGFVQTPGLAGWVVLAVGFALSVLVWYSLAQGNARSELQEIETGKLYGELRRHMDQSAENDKRSAEREAAMLFHLEAIRGSDREIANLRASGYSLDSPQVQQVVESRNTSMATIQRIVSVTPGTGALDLTGYPPGITTSKQYISPITPSESSSGAHRPPRSSS